jgi:hypothetical protein
MRVQISKKPTLGVSILGILMILRVWFKTLEDPLIEGHFKRIQIDWAAPTKCAGPPSRLLSNIENKVKGGFGKRNDSTCKALMKNSAIYRLILIERMIGNPIEL